MGRAHIQAAGGVVLRDSPQGRQVLLIYRNRYNDWTLPKGKVDAGESLEQAAVREVLEETGYAVRLGKKIGEVHYEVKRGPKTVTFWHMTPLGEPVPIADTDEVAAIAWLGFDEALARLTYELDRQVLNIALNDAMREKPIP